MAHGTYREGASVSLDTSAFALLFLCLIIMDNRFMLHQLEGRPWAKLIGHISWFIKVKVFADAVLAPAPRVLDYPRRAMRSVAMSD